MKKTKYILAAILVMALAAAPAICSRMRPGYLRMAEVLEEPVKGAAEKNEKKKPKVPTQIIKIGDDYFLEDCYNNQILTADSLDCKISDWMVLAKDVNWGHTIAGDGTVYLADDTDNNRVLIFEKRDGEFFMTQILEDTGVRPHFIYYDEETEQFYCWSSMTGEMYVLERQKKDNRVGVKKILAIPELNGIYVRSFTVIDGEVYFVSGNQNIIRASLEDLSVIERYPVPEEIAGMIQITKIQDYYYITVSTDLYGDQDKATILRVKDLHDLENGEWEDIYHYFVGGGTPYYISCFDGHYYLTEHRIKNHYVWQFDVEENEITNVELIY